MRVVFSGVSNGARNALGQTLAQTSPKRDIQGGSGFYIYMASRNGEVPYWRWVPKRSEAGK